MPSQAFTIAILQTTSDRSPATAAARSANSWCQGWPAAGLRTMVAMTKAATAISPAAIGRLTVPTKTIAQMVAMHGGSTFHTSMFSTVNRALEVAVTRAVNAPGEAAAK